MKKTNHHTQANHSQLTDKTRSDINAIDVPQMSRILRKLLLKHKLSPAELAEALHMPSQAIHKLLHNHDSYPKISKLMPIAKFFRITIGQLIGEETLNVADSTVNAEDAPTKVSHVLRRLLLDNRMRPHELSATLGIPQKTMHQLLYHSEIYPKLSTLLPIARFFKVTIGQLIGEEALESRITDKDSLRILDNDLYMKCAEHAIQLFKKHKVALNEKLATKVILDIYRYSLRHYKPTVPHYKSTATVDQAFAHWYVFMCADDTNQKNI